MADVPTVRAAKALIDIDTCVHGHHQDHIDMMAPKVRAVLDTVQYDELIRSLRACTHALRLQLGIRYQRLGLDEPANRAAYEADMEPVLMAEALLVDLRAQDDGR